MIQRVMDIMPIDQASYKIAKVIGTVNRFKTQISANISSAEEFVQLYNTKNETIRIHTANPSSRYYRYKHKTRYENTKEVKAYLEKHPSARVQNTNCKFSMAIKPLKKSRDFNTLIDIEWNHNHSTITTQP